MRRIILWLAVLSAATATHSLAEPWTIGTDCKPEDQVKYDRFDQSVRAAALGSPVYVPKPFPTTERQAIADFLYQYKSWHWEKADPKRLPEGEARLLTGILESTVTFQVLRVENWDATRCGREQRNDFYHLLRIFDAANGAEISRVALHPSGLWAAKRNFFGGMPFLPLPDPNVVLRDELAPFYNYDSPVDRGSAQYIVHIGSIVCGWTEPCLAFRHGSDAYIFFRHPLLPRMLLKIAGNEPRYILQPGDVQRGRLGAIPSLRKDGAEMLFQLGGSLWTIARKVNPSAAFPAQ